MKKCVIDGSWALLLRAARFAGVAPVQLTKCRNGYSVSVSRSYNIYSKILMTLINCAGVIGIIIHFQKNGIHINIRDTLFWTASNIVLNSVITLLGAYKGPIRMINMIEYIGVFEKISGNINSDRGIQSKCDRTRKATLLLYFTTCCPLITHSLTVYSIIILINASGNIFFFIHQFLYISKFLLEIQIMYLALKTFEAFVLLNHQLEGILWITESAKIKEVSRNIRTLTKFYVYICDVAFRMTKDDGFIMFLVLMDLIYSVIINGHLIFLGFSQSRVSPEWFYIMISVIFFFKIVKILLYIENYHRIYNKASNTQVILSKIMFHLTAVGQRISIDLELMYKQLILNSPQYSPLGIFSLRRSNIITILGVVSTCVIYLVQINS